MQGSIFPSITQPRGITVDLDWPQLVGQYFLIDVPCRADKDGPLFSPAIFVDSNRRLENVIGFQSIVLDFDNTEIVNGVKQRLDVPGLPDDVITELDGLTYVYHSSYNNLSEWPKWRLIVPLDRQVNPVEWRACVEGLLYRLGGIDGIDMTCKELARAYWLPSCSLENKHAAFAEYITGEIVKADDLIADSDTVIINPDLKVTSLTGPVSAPPVVSSGRNDQLKNIVCAMLNRGETIETTVGEILREDAKNVPPLFSDASEGFNFGTKAGATQFVTNILKTINRARSQIGIQPLGETPAPVLPPACRIVDAASWLSIEPPTPDQIIKDVLDMGDKLAIFAPSKLRKSFFVLQLCISLASGRNFLGLTIPKPRRVLLVQLEITEGHFHKRVFSFGQALDIAPEEIGDRLGIINGRGGDINFDMITLDAIAHQAEFIIVDPFYKINDGDENDSSAMKEVMKKFDKLSKDTGAASCYVHHDKKNYDTSQAARDRGSGSGIMSRDFDAGITLTEHKDGPNLTIVEFLLRNYPRHEPFTVEWLDERFVRSDLEPEIKKRATKEAKTEISFETYVMGAIGMLKAGPMPIEVFKTQVKETLRTSRTQARAIADYLIEHEKVAILNQNSNLNLPKMIGLPEHIKSLKSQRDVKEMLSKVEN